MTASAPILSLRGISKAYVDATGARTEVLEGIDLDVSEGEFIAILGFSGSGKTTLISTIAGLLEPDSGEIIVKGQPSSDLVRIVVWCSRATRCSHG